MGSELQASARRRRAQQPTILGTATDSTGAIMPGAKVTVTALTTGKKREATANATGERLLATSALLFASSAFAAQNLTGLWTIHSKINDSESDVECKLVVTNNKIAGACNFQGEDRQVTGTVDGDKVTFQYDTAAIWLCSAPQKNQSLVA